VERRGSRGLSQDRSWAVDPIGRSAFLGLATWYTFTTLHRPDWILSIAGPLYLTGLLYGWSGWTRRTHAH